MSRNLVITCGEGQTGHLIAELLLTNEKFSSAIKTLHVATCNQEHVHIKALSESGAQIIPVTPGNTEGLTKSLKDSGADTILIIPPSVSNKLEATKEMVEASKAAGIQNVVLISSAGCDMAERDHQPRLREFVDIENLVMKTKGDTKTETGHSPCIIRCVDFSLRDGKADVNGAYVVRASTPKTSCCIISRHKIRGSFRCQWDPHTNLRRWHSETSPCSRPMSSPLAASTVWAIKSVASSSHSPVCAPQHQLADANTFFRADDGGRKRTR
jgi:hypothetical protein